MYSRYILSFCPTLEFSPYNFPKITAFLESSEFFMFLLDTLNM
uniref:Uncharacterized protein n=1 Tax=Arundo donax TaxID=35708 RepID=A0A0A9H1P0_ARUDO